MTNRISRTDGEVTRQHILEVAAQLFAQKGYALTTSKEICQKAKTNVAAVNYHFGSREELYKRVLLEMHDRLISVDTLNHILHGSLTPEQKLGAVLDELVKSLVERKWHARMYIREILSPTPMLDHVLTEKILPKFGLIKGIISEITGIAVNDPAIIRCLLNVIGPNAVLLVSNDSLLAHLFPDIRNNAQTLASHLKTFALAGLKAIAKEYKTINKSQK